MTAPVYVAPLRDVSDGATVVLEGQEGHHAATVRRTRVGERVDLVDGEGRRAHCEVSEVRKGSLTLVVNEIHREPEPSPRVTLVQALAKGGRDEQAVETSTEYGIAALIPWQSSRTVVNWRGKEAKGRARWEATARAAAKQSRRAWVPAIEEVHTTTQLTARLREEAARGTRIYVCHEEGETTLVRRLWEGTAAAERGNEIYVVVGPEGGICAEELAEFSALGADIVLLAPHVLRSATAGPYAMATLAAMHQPTSR